MSDGCLFDLLSLVQHAEWEERLECTSLPLQAWLKQNRAGTSYSTAVEALYILILRGISPQRVP